MKRRWSCLHNEIRIKLSQIPALIISCCVLHNIAIERKLPDIIDNEFIDNQPEPENFNNLENQ
jgi:hypothetical protein